MTQEKSHSGSIGDSKHQFVIHIEPDKVIKLKNNTIVLAVPHDFSGSLVWNTRFVEYQQSQKNWKSSEAQVTGIICIWDPDTTSLLATKVEHLSLLDLSRQRLPNT